VHLDLVLAEDPRHEGPDVLLVVDDQDAVHGNELK
jgi:hypothetical protein